MVDIQSPTAEIRRRKKERRRRRRRRKKPQWQKYNGLSYSIGWPSKLKIIVSNKHATGHALGNASFSQQQRQQQPV